MRYTFNLKTLLLAALVAVPFTFGNLNAQEAAPAAAPAAAEAEPEAGPVDDYLELVESSGAEFAPAFDFFTVSMLWTVIAAAMVFIMHLGFATLEVGLTQSKNTVNILFKNSFIIAIGIVSYALIGFNTHYPGDFNGWLSIGAPIGDLNADGGDGWGYGGLALAMTGYGDFIFQAMFAATAATIVSGAVAERIKLPAFMIFATLLVGLAYPIVGSWHWGGGWMGGLNGGNGFKDFAGSAVVHAFGGFAALACVILLGARKGKYTERRNQAHPRAQHASGCGGCFPALLRLVRLQRRFGPLGGSRPSRSCLHHHGAGGLYRCARCDSRFLDRAEEARSLDDPQRFPCRSRGYHRQRGHRLPVGRDDDRAHRRYHRGFLGALL